jgi:MoxR-like ATPase
MPYDSESMKPSEELIAMVGNMKPRFDAAKQGIGQRILDQDKVIENCMITLLAGGHGILNGVPGLAKTKLVVNLASVFGLAAKKQQFTPDLLPQNLKGSEVRETDKNGRTTFRFVPGPLFAQLFMADEVNRAPGRVQSGLLEAMQEKIVTFDGVEHELPKPFHVLATMNPLDQEGTYPLTEANKDRFMMEIKVHRPSRGAEKRIMLGVGNDNSMTPQFFTSDELIEMQKMVERMPMSERVSDAILDLVRSTIPSAEEVEDRAPKAGEISKQDYLNARSSDEKLRARASLPAMMKVYISPPEDIGDGGAGVRATMALKQCVCARAFMQGRLTPSIDDVIALAEPVLRHRLTLTPYARTNKITVQKLIDAALAPLRPETSVKAALADDTATRLTQAATQAFSGIEETPIGPPTPVPTKAPSLLQRLGRR